VHILICIDTGWGEIDKVSTRHVKRRIRNVERRIRELETWIRDVER